MESRKRASALGHVAIVGLGLVLARPAAAQPAPPPPGPSATVEASRPPRDIESRAGRAEYCTDRARKVLAQRAAGVANDAVPTREQRELDEMHLRCFDNAKSGPTSGAADLGAEVLRSVAQVVLNRAMRAGWTLLATELRDAAECDAPATTTRVRFPATCRVLGTVAIQDLVSSPAVLTDAFMSDLLQALLVDPAHAWMAPALLDDALRESAVRWNQGGAAGLTSAFQQVINRGIRQQVRQERCDAIASTPDKAMWVAGMCLVEVQSPGSFANCDIDGWTDQCDAGASRGIKQISSIFTRIHGAHGKPALADLAELVFTSADLQIDADAALLEGRKATAHEYVGGAKAVILGLASRDWVRATSGAIRALRVVSTSTELCADPAKAPACVAALDARARTERLVTLLAAVGNYAETLTATAKDGGASARDKIIEDLIDRMVNRTHRTRGAVVSLGGNLALFGGVRTDFKRGAEAAFPAQLGLGVGLQTYEAENRGFHAMVSIVDLGQYVTTGSKGLSIQPPRVEDAMTLGLTAGGWFALRETPVYAGVHGGVSPFVRTSDGQMTYQLGIVTGIYVPLLDFN
jgi:hypothetical protein